MRIQHTKVGCLFIVSALVLTVFVGKVRADTTNEYQSERVTNFDSIVTINPDSSLTVKESIRVYAGGYAIKRGIYRDFPLKYKDEKGFSYNTTFDVQNVLRDGVKDDYHTESLTNGIRLYIGSSDMYLKPGFYTYVIDYTTKRQLGFFADHDELYYNITGNGWDFTVENATAVILMPEGLQTSAISHTAYTGISGSRGQDFVSGTKSSFGYAVAYFATTKPLYYREGLTVVVGWPKGYVYEPTVLQKAFDFILANIGIFIGAVILVLISAYYLVVWYKFGRDPKGAGTLVTQYELPKAISPAGARYIHKMSYDTKAISSSLVNTAIKGYIKLTEKNNQFSISSVKNDYSGLAGEEQAILRELLNRSTKSFTFNNAEATKVAKAIDAFKTSLEVTYLTTYFRNNHKLLVIPACLILVYFPTLFISSMVFVSLLLLFCMILVTIFGMIAVRARTVLGRKVEDQILGLRNYLTAVENPKYASDINYETPDSLKVYEKYLPYAIALDVEPIWTKRFKTQIEASKAIENNRSGWYYSSSHIASYTFASSLGSSLAHSVSAASTPPGSKSGLGGGGGGGGSSGGGGGGGGGGGW